MARGTIYRYFSISLVLATILAISACAPAAAPPPSAPTQAPAAQPTKPAAKTVIDLQAGTATPKGGSEADAMDKFGELVARKTNGEVRVVNQYTALGVEQQLMSEVMTGSVALGTMSSGNASRWSNALLPWDLPFLFNSYDDALLSIEGPVARAAIERYEKELNIKHLFPVSLGSGRDIQTRTKQLKVPADIKGLKIRVVSSPVDLATFQAWGANPTPVDWGQTYAALQQGVVDGEGIAFNSTYTAKHHEVIKYVLRINYQPLIEMAFINPKKFESLSPQNQKALLEAAQEAKAWSWKNEKERLADTDKKLREAGVTPYTPTPDEYKLWTAIRDQVWTKVGEELKGKLDMDMVTKLYDSQKK